MKLPYKINPVHCSSKDGTRYILNSVSIQGDIAVSTDGRSLFAVKGTRDDEDDPRDAIIPKRVATAAWPQKKRKRGTFLPNLKINPVTAVKTCTVTNTDFDQTTVKEIEGTFPPIEKVIPNASGYTQRVGLNVKLLLNIAKCFGEDQILIHFDSEGWRNGQNDNCMLITTSNNDDAFGILMPLRNHDADYSLQRNKAIETIQNKAKLKETTKLEEEAKAKTEAWLTANQATAY